VLTVDADLRASITAHGQRVAWRHAPSAVAATVFEELDRVRQRRAIRGAAFERDANRA
jgi:hypothetical protein